MARWVSKIALLIITTMLAQPFCPALKFEQQSSVVASAPQSDCHDSLPETPAQPQPSKTCCTASHSQIAKPAMRYVAPQIGLTDEASLEQAVVILSQSGLRSSELLWPSTWRHSSVILRI
ncbi:MAG TPA: hypothetical protein VJA94_10330 [Candidatus Angelobacter sp.]